MGWQEGNDLISLQQGWKKISQLYRKKLSQLKKEALQEFNMEDKITWIRMVRNNLLALEMSNYSWDSSWMGLPEYGIDENVNNPKESRLQTKLMLLIWMKWRDKYLTFMEQLMHKYATDSSKVLPQVNS